MRVTRYILNLAIGLGFLVLVLHMLLVSYKIENDRMTLHYIDDMTLKVTREYRCHPKKTPSTIQCDSTVSFVCFFLD